MRVVFMGTPDFAVETLKAILEAGHEVALAVTKQDKPKGRGNVIQMSPVKECALLHGIPVFQPRRVREAESIAHIRKYRPEIIITVAFGQILSKEIIEMPEYGCINVHASLLPKYRGAAPIQWAVINGEKESGVTIMQMDEGLDTGDMLTKVVVPLDEKETGGSLFDKLSAAGAKLCAETLDMLELGGTTPEKQGESPTDYASMLTKEMGKIDWTKSAVSVERLVRGLNPWPSAYTKLNGKNLKIWECQVVSADASKGVCGEILEVTKDSMIVQTGEGALAVKALQLEGKKRMDAGAFLRGFSVETGTILGAE